jgi:hypothetical protein
MDEYIAELRLPITRCLVGLPILANDMSDAVRAAEELADVLGFEFHDVNLKDKS